MTSVSALRLTQSIKTSTAELYRALTVSMAVREWFCDVAITNPVGDGQFYYGWQGKYAVMGAFLNLVKNETVKQSWMDTNGVRSEVTYSIEADGDGCVLTICHENRGDEALWQQHLEETHHGWLVGLENLVSTQETGGDLRVLRRPMVGIYPSEVNADMALRRDLPVNFGIMVEDVVDGLSAQKSGLRSGDVIIAINQQKIADFAAMAMVMKGKVVGDQVGLTYLRDGKAADLILTLCNYTRPEVPATPAALAAQYHEKADKAFTGLVALFQGISEETTSIKPAPMEWCAREVLAHLIQTEHDWHSRLNEVLSDAERIQDNNPENSDAHIQATTATYPTIDRLLEALKTAQTETTALLRNLPDAFVKHKATYRRIGENLPGLPQHIENHYQQIQATMQG